MTWATDRRIDFITWRIATAGTIRRIEIAEIFGISDVQASIDISKFLRLYPEAVTYDKSARCYRANGTAINRTVSPHLCAYFEEKVKAS